MIQRMHAGARESFNSPWALPTSLAKSLFIVRGRPVFCRTFSDILGFHPVEASNIYNLLHQSHDNQNCLQKLPKVS